MEEGQGKGWSGRKVMWHVAGGRGDGGGEMKWSEKKVDEGEEVVKVEVDVVEVVGGRRW